MSFETYIRRLEKHISIFILFPNGNKKKTLSGLLWNIFQVSKSFVYTNENKSLCMLDFVWIFRSIYSIKTDRSKPEAQQQSMIFLCTQVWGCLCVYQRAERHRAKSVLTFLKGHIPLILIAILVLLKWWASTRTVKKCWLARLLTEFIDAEVSILYQSW